MGQFAVESSPDSFVDEDDGHSSIAKMVNEGRTIMTR